MLALSSAQISMIPFNNNEENTAVFFFYINNRFLNQCTTKLIMIGLEDLVVPEGVIAQWLCTWLPLYALLTDIVKIWVLVIFYIYFYILLI